jgi:hypothetical protein
LPKPTRNGGRQSDSGTVLDPPRRAFGQRCAIALKTYEGIFACQPFYLPALATPEKKEPKPCPLN